MKSNAMKVFLVNTILCIIGVNGMLLIKAAFGHIPFQFNLYWGLIAPIICGVASGISTASRNNKRACQE